MTKCPNPDVAGRNSSGGCAETLEYCIPGRLCPKEVANRPRFAAKLNIMKTLDLKQNGMSGLPYPLPANPFKTRKFQNFFLQTGNQTVAYCRKPRIRPGITHHFSTRCAEPSRDRQLRPGETARIPQPLPPRRSSALQARKPVDLPVISRTAHREWLVRRAERRGW